MKETIKNIDWLLRIPVSSTFIIHGLPKMGKNVLDGDIWYLGYLVGPFELFGALFVLLGPFVHSMLTRIGSILISIIMIGAIYLHLFKWGDRLVDVEWQLLLLAVSIYFIFKNDGK
tara:strand:- start:225 stop:572 length:348 start_codon:yes stop_codon:yes gene_type:complete